MLLLYLIDVNLVILHHLIFEFKLFQINIFLKTHDLMVPISNMKFMHLQIMQNYDNLKIFIKVIINNLFCFMLCIVQNRVNTSNSLKNIQLILLYFFISLLYLVNYIDF